MAAKNSVYKHMIIVAIWIIIVVATSSGRTNLTEDIDNSAEFLDPDTPSGKGFELIEERFNQTDDIIHIVVLSVPEDSDELITDPVWQEFTLALTVRLNQTMFPMGYFQIFSEPLLLQAAAQETNPEFKKQLSNFAESQISQDQKYGLITLISKVYDFDSDQEVLKEHVQLIREITGEPDLIVEFGSNTMSLPTIADADLDLINIDVTGQVASFVDLIVVSENAFGASELVAVTVVIIILFLVFRSPLGVSIPVIAMFASLTPTYMLTFLLAKQGVFPVSDFLPSIIAMIGIAVGVDYNLFSLVRFREEFRKRRAVLEARGNWNKETIRETQINAASKMNATAGQAVMYSGFTVITGFISFLVLDSEFSLGMAIGVSIVVAFSVLTARTLTPAILSLFGQYLDWPNVMSRAEQDVNRQKDIDQHKEEERKGFWVRWSKRVMRYPIAFLLIGLIIMAPFIALSAETELSFDSIKNLPEGTESREGFEVIVDNFNLGQSQPYVVVISGGSDDNSIFNANIITAANAFGQWALNENPEILGVGSLSMSMNETSNTLIKLSLQEVVGALQFNPLFSLFTANFVNYEFGNNTLIIELYANLDSGTSKAWKLAERIRDKSNDFFGDIDEVEEYYVTGLSASFNDTSDAMYSKVPLMILVAVVLIYLALLVLFRSLILPLKAILTIGGSILFGLGTLVLVFQRGWFTGDYPIWQAEQTSGLMFFIPIFIFTTILGLGMDYSIFIISRIKEEYEKGEEISDAVGIGLAKTAGVVTSAATIMTATFMVFALAPILVLKTMGLALAVGIIIDATISRLILLPAAMKLAGRWNWYLPKWLQKILPKIDLEH